MKSIGFAPIPVSLNIEMHSEDLILLTRQYQVYPNKFTNELPMRRALDFEELEAQRFFSDMAQFITKTSRMEDGVKHVQLQLRISVPKQH